MAWLARLVLLSVALLLGPAAQAQDFVAPEVIDVRLSAAPVHDLPTGWTTVPGVMLQIHGDARTRSRLVELSRHGSAAIPRLADALGIPIGGNIHVFVADTSERFDSLQPGNAPQWAGGTAYPSRGWIFLKSPRAAPGGRPMEMVFDHELIHILLGRAFAPHAPPRWLQEGLAQVHAGELMPDTTAVLARGLAGSGLYTLEQITEGFPRDAAGASLAYAQSTHFMGWFEETYGRGAVQRLIRELAAGKSIDTAVFNATGGTSLSAAQDAWQETIDSGEAPTWLYAVTSVDAWWTIAAVIAIVALVVARLRTRRRMTRMKEEEDLLDQLQAQWRSDGYQ